MNKVVKSILGSIAVILLCLLYANSYYKIKNSINSNDNSIDSEQYVPDDNENNSQEELTANDKEEEVTSNPIDEEIKTDDPAIEEPVIDEKPIENKEPQPTITEVAPPVVEQPTPSPSTQPEPPKVEVTPPVVTAPPVQEPVKTCTPKKFIWSWFRPDFDSQEKCIAKGNEYLGRYGYSCSDIEDECGTRYYMLDLFDSNGSGYDYRTIPTNDQITQ